MASQLQHVISCQQRLIEALDARDPEALETATAELADALAALKSFGAVYGISEAELSHAMKQAEAARVRVNVLANWTRQRIDRLNELRAGPVVTYGSRKIYEPIG